MVTIQREYVAGACNIGVRERMVRLSVGWAGLAVTVALEIAFIVWNVPAAFRLSIFLPSYAASIGLLQGFSNFCAKYGMRGQFNFTEQLGQTESVEENENLRKDRRKAIALVSISFAIASFVAIGAYFLTF